MAQKVHGRASRTLSLPRGVRPCYARQSCLRRPALPDRKSARTSSRPKARPPPTNRGCRPLPHRPDSDLVHPSNITFARNAAPGRLDLAPGPCRNGRPLVPSQGDQKPEFLRNSRSRGNSPMPSNGACRPVTTSRIDLAATSPPTTATGHVQDVHHLYRRISKAGGARCSPTGSAIALSPSPSAN